MENINIGSIVKICSSTFTKNSKYWEQYINTIQIINDVIIHSDGDTFVAFEGLRGNVNINDVKLVLTEPTESKQITKKDLKDLIALSITKGIDLSTDIINNTITTKKFAPNKDVFINNVYEEWFNDL